MRARVVNGLMVGLAVVVLGGMRLAAQRNHHECGPSRGVYLAIDHIEAMEEAFANLGAGAGDIDLILTTDGEQVLGIGDGGMSGIERSIGKLAVYTAAGRIDGPDQQTVEHQQRAQAQRAIAHFDAEQFRLLRRGLVRECFGYLVG
jgi:malic enzyme